MVGTMEDEDLEELLGKAGPSKADLDNLNRMVQRVIELTQFIEQGEEAIAEARRELAALTKKEMPEIMQAANMKKFAMTNGVSLSLLDTWEGALPKTDPERRERGLQWLKEHDGADIIQNEIVVSLGRNSDNTAKAVVSALEDIGVDYLQQENVHHATLKKFAKEKIAAGEDVNLEDLGLWFYKEVKVKFPK